MGDGINSAGFLNSLEHNKHSNFVAPAEAGAQLFINLDSRLRGNDDKKNRLYYREHR